MSRRWLLIPAIALLLVLLVGVSAVVGTRYWLQHSGRQKVIELLEQRFDDVQLRALDFQWDPGISDFSTLRAQGDGLSLSLKDREGLPPFIAMREFSIELSLTQVWQRPIHIRGLRLDELVIQIPPKEEKERVPGEEPEKGRQGIPPIFVIERLVADGTTLRILKSDPGKDPMVFDLHELETRSIRSDGPLDFSALLDNPKPPGLIQTTGRFGPFVLEDPGLSPVSGEYLFENADLSVFGGIGGLLFSKGTFDGVLKRIEVEGSTQVPDFHLKAAGMAVPLETEFEAIVDGTSGDTYLQPVRARLGTSAFETRGAVSKEEEGQGKTVRLHATAEKGRVEDFLRLAVPSEELLMKGSIHFDSEIVIPPGDRDVTQKIFLDGSFRIDDVHFPNTEVQGRVNELSDLGLGKRGENKGEGVATPAVPSDIGGRFVLEEGTMTIRDLSFEVPGSQVTLLGTYGLADQRVNFRGELRSQAKVSEMTSGVKSFFLKAVDPLFKRDGAGAVIPIKITGTPTAIDFGVEKGRIFTRKDAVSLPKD